MSRDQLKEKAELGFEQHRQTEQLLQLLLLLLSPRTSFLCKSKFFRLRNVWETCQLNNHMRMSEVFIGISNEKRNRTPLITNYNFYCDLIIKKKNPKIRNNKFSLSCQERGNVNNKSTQILLWKHSARSLPRTHSLRSPRWPRFAPPSIVYASLSVTRRSQDLHANFASTFIHFSLFNRSTNRVN